MSARKQQPEPQPCANCSHPEGTTNWGTGKRPYYLCEDRKKCTERILAAAVPAKDKPVRKPRARTARKPAAAEGAT